MGFHCALGCHLLQVMQVFPSPDGLSPAKTNSRNGDRPAVSRRPKALFIVDGPSLDLIYPLQEQQELQELADFYAPPQTRDSIIANRELLRDAEVIFSGWGAPVMDEAFLKAAPNLKAVFYGAGTIGYCTSEAFWDRDILITSAYAGNAVPVAEYTLGVIMLSLKNFWRFVSDSRSGGGVGNHTRYVPGCFRTTVALIGCGMIGRRLLALLEPFDLRSIVYDPFLTEAEADQLGAKLCTLDEAFQQGDVVSLHAASKRETRGLITGRHFSLMKQGATFINTARGQIVREKEMIEALGVRTDLTAVIDVVDTEPIPVDSPLLTLPNVLYTPHIAGSLGPECGRLGQYMVQEFKRYLAGEPLQWQITREMVARLA